MRAALWPALICRCLGLQSLRYIPLSLSSSIFSSVRVPRCPHRCAPLTAARSQVLVFNAIVARLWLKERVQVTEHWPARSSPMCRPVD